MNLESFYLVCFVVGLVLCLLSVLGGTGHGHGGHFHLGSHAGRAGAAGHLTRGAAMPQTHGSQTANSAGRGSISPVNGFTLTAFLCWFGGAGYLLRTHSPVVAPLVLLLSSLSGLAGAAVVFWFLSAILLPHERALLAEETQIVGVVGTVTSALRPGGTGEIVFSQLGARRSSPARSEDHAAIERDTEVIVMRYEHGVAYVRRWDDLAP